MFYPHKKLVSPHLCRQQQSMSGSYTCSRASSVLCTTCAYTPVLLGNIVTIEYENDFTEALFSSRNFFSLVIITLLFVFDNYFLIID